MAHPESSLAEEFHKLGCCVIVPTYNNAATSLKRVLQELQRLAPDIIVVNDGSTDETATVLAAFEGLTIITFSENQGKGRALQAAFQKAREMGFDYAISIDSDGQHYPADLVLLLQAIRQNPDSLIVGARNMEQHSVPRLSSFGHNFSNFWYKLQTWIPLPDTQSGFRVYPVHLLSKLRFYTPRFEFEIEVLVKAAWAGIPVVSTPVRVYYPPADERVSHFRPIQDFARISVLNAWFVVLTVLYYGPKRLLFSKKKLLELKAQLSGQHEPRYRVILAAMLGAFVGISPAWGYQLAIALVLAHLFRLNKFIAAIFTNVSLPPLIPLILYGSLVIGCQLLDISMPPINPSEIPDWNQWDHYLYAYLVGSAILGVLVACTVAMLLWLLLPSRKHQKAMAT